ncbi:MAG: YfcE family phosphodiesterase [Clostridia bacterium]|nr:YfcE family phosphodiesterase [Clostridia bacterium]
MRLLVVSDSHRHYQTLRKILLLHREADRIIFLGDGIDDFDKLDLPFPISPILICGNNDWGSIASKNELLNLDGIKVYCTHGHLEHVKYGEDALYMTALKNDAKLVLFGHTHNQYYEYSDGIHLFNPGAVMDGNYGLVDIVNGQIMCIKANIFDR